MIHVYTDMAGLVSFAFGRWCVHLFPERAHWEWGHGLEAYDQIGGWFGLGPLALITYTYLEP